jgi:hypothetical protein
MLHTFARRIVEKAAVRGLAFAVAIGSEEIPLVDLRGKLPTACAYPERDMGAVTGIIIHHSATKGQPINSIAQFHVATRGWCGIAYHYGVDSDSKVYLLNDPERKTNHAAGNNTRNIGICLIGNYDEQPVPPEVVHSAARLVAMLQHKYGPLRVMFHSDTKATACPGRYAREALDRLKTR